MSTSLSSFRAAHGRWLIALSALLVAPACGRDGDPAAPATGAASIDFSKVSVDDPSQLAGALRNLGIEPATDEPLAVPDSLQRSATTLPAHLLWPLGEVRREGLTTYRLDLDLAAFASSGSDTATLRFRDGDTVLFQEAMNADAWSVVKPLPAAVLEAAKKGNVITWGLVLAERKAKPIEGSFKVIEKAPATRKFTELAADRRLARTPILLSLAQAQLLENYTLLAEALPIYVELSGREEIKKTGFAGVARCLQRLASNQKQLGLRDSNLYHLALEKMTPTKGSGSAAPPSGTGPGLSGPTVAGGGKIDAPASGSGSKTVIPPTVESTPGSGAKPVGPSGSVPPGTSGPVPADPSGLPVTPPVETPTDTPTEPAPAGADSLLSRAGEVMQAHVDRLRERAQDEARRAEKAHTEADHATQQALASRQAADAAQKRFEDALAASHGQPTPGTDPAATGPEQLKALKDAADLAQERANADEAQAKAVREVVRLAEEKATAANAAAREQLDAVRRTGQGTTDTLPGAQPSGPAPVNPGAPRTSPGGAPPGGVPAGGTPTVPAPGGPMGTLTAPQVEALIAAVAASKASAETEVTDATEALQQALAARAGDPSPANVGAVKDARARLEKAQQALDKATSVAEHLRHAAEGSGTPPTR